MQEREFNELAGRIEGLSRAIIFLIDEADQDEILDSEMFTGRLRQFSEILNFDHPHLEATKRTLNELADQVDTARSVRR